MKFNSQICTTREQSERLLALGLKPETADMAYLWYGRAEDDTPLLMDKPSIVYQGIMTTHDLPAWSLHRLVSAITNNGIIITFIDNIVIVEKHQVFQKSYEFWDDVYDNICDAYEWLIKEGYFKKEYLTE